MKVNCAFDKGKLYEALVGIPASRAAKILFAVGVIESPELSVPSELHENQDFVAPLSEQQDRLQDRTSRDLSQD